MQLVIAFDVSVSFINWIQASSYVAERVSLCNARRVINHWLRHRFNFTIKYIYILMYR